jgi:hypothetical protein
MDAPLWMDIACCVGDCALQPATCNLDIEGKFGVSFEVGSDGGMDAMTKGIVHVGAPCHGEKTAQVLQLLYVYNTLILEGLSSACQSSVRCSYINP